ncbi:MAG TPA: CHASE domain-containing protein [Zeimonas sp.]|nr:CHASE domain-containing protein [Zeimonas sp.]
MGDLWHRITERTIGKGLAVFVLLLGMGIALLVWRSESARVRDESDARTLEYVSTLAARIEQRLVAYDLVVRAGASLFAATQAPTREQWRSFVAAFNLAETYPGLQAIAFATFVPPEAVSALEEHVQAEGLDRFRVWPTGPRVESSAILYIEPMNAANARALGFDMLSNPERRQAMHASRDSGETTLSRAVGLVQDAGGERRAGVLMYRAVYATGTVPESVVARRASLQGWVYAPFRPADLMRSIGAVHPSILVRLYETSSTDPRALLYQDAGAEDAGRDWSAALRVPIRALDRRWTLEAIRVPVPGVVPLSDSGPTPWLLPAGVSLVTLLLFAVLWSMATTRDRAHALASEMTAALRRANEELDTRVRQRTEALSASNLQLREEIAERQRVERERSAALERERGRVAQLRALADAGLAIPSLPDDQARLEHLADRARQLVRCRHALLLREGMVGPRRIAVSSVEPMTFANRRALLEASRHWPEGTGEAIERVRFESARVDPRAWPEGCRDALIVPIRIGHGPVLARLVLLHGENVGFVDEDEVLVHQLVLLVTAAMATADAIERERAARLDAEAANASKDEFLAIVSHELRTPLHAILGWLQVIERAGADPAHLQRALQVIRRNAEAQSTLIDDLLDLARIEQGKLALAMDRVRLDHVARDAVESQRQVAEASGITIELHVDVQGEVLGDAMRLQQAVANLLVNSMKFSRSGGRVTVRLQRDEEGHLELRVEDEGDGIEVAFLPYVFDRFRQGEAGGRDRQGGLGLGLALVKHIVEAHGGEVSAHSEGKGKGAQFTMRLPALAGTTLQTPAWLGFFDSVARRRRPSVLVIEGDADVRSSVARRLQDDDIAVVGFDDASAAFEWLEGLDRDDWPSAIFCDLESRGLDGFALYDAVRTLETRRGRTPPVPIAALATRTAGVDREPALEHGFIAYLVKPVSLEHLERVLERVLAAHLPMGDARPDDRPDAQVDARPGATGDDVVTDERRYRS